MKKVAYVVLGLVVLIVVGIVVIPRVIDWNGFKPEIVRFGRRILIDETMFFRCVRQQGKRK